MKKLPASAIELSMLESLHLKGNPCGVHGTDAAVFSNWSEAQSLLQRVSGLTVRLEPPLPVPFP